MTANQNPKAIAALAWAADADREPDPPEPVPFAPEGPQPLLRPIPLGADYPVDALGPLAEAVRAVQGMTLAPMAIPAQSALAVAALAVQGFANVETLGGVSPPSLYCLTIARSGERKSSCDAPLMAALRQFELDESRALGKANTSWINKQALWKGDRDKILAEAKNPKAEKRTAAQADLDALGPEPVAPPSANRTVTEPTFEGLTKQYVDGQPSLGVFTDEGGQFIGGHAMNSDNRTKTMAGLNKLWQGDPIQRTRAGDGSYTLFGRRLAVHLMMQPDVARPLLADGLATGTGFLPRFLITEPPSTIGTRLSAKAQRDGPALWRHGNRLRAILDTPLPMDPDSRELTPRQLPLSADAREKLVVFADRIETHQRPGGTLAQITGFASKAAEQAARIAAVLTLWQDLDAGEVDAKAMDWGIALAQFYLSEARRLSDAASISVETAQAEKLRVWLMDFWPDRAIRENRDPGTIVARDIVLWGPSAMRETKKAQRLAMVLAEYGWLAVLDPGTVVDGSARKLAFRIVRG